MSWRVYESSFTLTANFFIGPYAWNKLKKTMWMFYISARATGNKTNFTYVSFYPFAKNKF